MILQVQLGSAETLDNCPEYSRTIDSHWLEKWLIYTGLSAAASSNADRFVFQLLLFLKFNFKTTV